MAIRVGATEPRPTHHIKLTDGVSSLGLILCDGNGNANPKGWQRIPMQRTSIKTYQGTTGPGDMELPWSVFPQQDWSGGMLNEYLDEASSSYRFGAGIDTSRENRVVIAGLATPNAIGEQSNSNWPSLATEQYVWQRVTAAKLYYAIKFTASSNYTATKLTIPYLQLDSPTLSVYIYTDVAGSPGVLHGTIFAPAPVLFPSENLTDFVTMDFTGIPLIGSTSYWLVILATAATSTKYIDLLGLSGSSATCKTSANGTTWAADTSGPPIFHLSVGGVNNNDTILFSYKHAIYAVTKAGALYINGYRGAASSGSTATIVDTGAAWTVNQWAGAIAVIYAGTGSNEKRYWRAVTSNTADTLTFAELWDTAPAVNTEFVIVGTGYWTAITGTGSPTNVLDVHVWSGNVYFAQGDSADIVRMRSYNSSGTITTDFTAQTGHQGTFMLTQPDSDTSRLLYMKTSGLLHWETAPAEGSNLPVYATTNEKQVGDPVQRVNDIILYDEDNSIWVFMTDSPYYVKASGNNTTFTYTPLKYKLSEIGAAGDYRLGRALATHNAYLYFALQNTLQRHHSNVLDSVGLDKGTGLPEQHAGGINTMYGYPGRLLAAVESKPTQLQTFAIGDGPDYYYAISRSGIYMLYGGSWHPVWVAGYPIHGAFTTRLSYKVNSMLVQTTPGDYIDRLWFTWGPYIMWAPISLNPQTQSELEIQIYRYAPEGHFITSWMQFGLKDIAKFWYSLKLIHENYTGTSTIVDYQTDNDADWIELGTWSSTSQQLYSEEKLIGSYNVSGKRIRFRVRMRNNSYIDTTPTLKTMVTEALIRIPVKRSTTITFRVVDHDTALDEVPDDEPNGENKLTLLETWEESLTPLTCSAHISRLDGKRVFIDPYSLRTGRIVSVDGQPGGGHEYNICSATLIEV